MINLDKTLYGASLFALAFSLSVADVSAQTCTTAPSCDTLGFTKSSADCEGHSVLKCPFDQSKLYCDSGAGGGNSGGETGCNVGAILYSDKTCSAELLSGKTPIGVVFDANRGRAIGLGSASGKWSDDYFDIPGLSKYSHASDAKGDYLGASNTTAIIAYCKANSKNCPAFEYVANYSTPGTKMGDWYLPAAGELWELSKNKDQIETALGKISSAQKLGFDGYWSSSVASGGLTAYYLESISINDIKKSYEKKVRPVLAF